MATPGRAAGGALQRQQLRDDPALLRTAFVVPAHAFIPPRTDMLVFCFAERAHAEQFRARFGGDFIDPKSRPKWPGTKR